jgi:elongator complex protein 3
MASGQDLARRQAKWQAAHGQTIDIDEYEDDLVTIIEQIAAADKLEPQEITRLLYRVSRGQGPLAKDQLVHGYRELVARGVLPPSREILARLRTKPIRTLSGVAPVTVLTKPFPCPGECIFCPEFAGMPKSYVPDEPGALRGGQLQFDPYLQTALRIRALENIGHSTDKVELLILGGTWSYYPPDYQEWFIQRCLDAMNGEESVTLEEAQRRNETAPHRNVGLVIETRPDYVDAAEVTRLRRLGVTKVQIGVQSLDDDILLRNKRGHTVEQTRQAFRLLRAGGFKIHAHWMPNLLGATPQSDLADFSRLWDDAALRPDELKIYPCSLIADTELYDRWERGEYHPYTDDELVDLVAECKTRVPPYCRINRVMRDIPAGHIIAGSKRSNLRQVVHRAMKARGQVCHCIRCREVRGQKVDAETLVLQDLTYDAGATREHFLSFETQGVRKGQGLPLLAGFLRLSLPTTSPQPGFLDEIAGAAMIREVHVYGPALEIGEEDEGKAQHAGLGTALIERAAEIARAAGFSRLAVIAATGTRDYYRARGFELGELYMTRNLGVTLPRIG